MDAKTRKQIKNIVRDVKFRKSLLNEIAQFSLFETALQRVREKQNG